MNREERNADLEQVIEKYSNMLYKICFVILKNEQDTKDVLQETFITYMTKRPGFASEEHKKAWLIKVSQNKCKEFLRFHKRHARIPLDEVEEALEITSGMNVEDKEKLRLIWNLNYNLKSVVILYYVEGYSVKETAQILRISEVAVKKRLQRARQILAKLGSAYEGGIVCEQV
ncbi:MAG: RNA polymerase sigma factor [Lachnospiraceae bacterium]|nr:RNA polymerase sigma factor [Lachnospiraceae bacterium]MBR5177316.1 RNA polymerase sigma factor [Lachnospiraceae bacterium]